jgi:CheY-like chemotaxis protein
MLPRAFFPDSTAMRQILLVDDDPNLLDSLIRPFRARRDEWSLTIALNGNAALQELDKSTFDLVITDVFMPKVDGITLLLHLRKSSPSTPIVAISGGGRHIGTNILDQARTLGARAVLEKPFEAADLLELVEELLAPI